METTGGLGKNQRGSKKKLLSSSKSISPDSKYDSSCNSKSKLADYANCCHRKPF